MNKITVLALILVTGLLAWPPQVQANTGGLDSLRGSSQLEADSTEPDFKKWHMDQQPLQRSYLQQPPLVPHAVEEYRIDLRQNKCLTCHSWRHYKETGATKISLTHFRDRFGSETATVSPQRYFCNQCHAPQMDTRPLIDNTFRPIDSIGGR